MSYHVLEIASYEGTSTFREQHSQTDAHHLETEGSLFAIIKVDVHGAAIVDDGYRSRAEAEEAWPEAIRLRRDSGEKQG